MSDSEESVEVYVEPEINSEAMIPARLFTKTELKVVMKRLLDNRQLEDFNILLKLGIRYGDLREYYFNKLDINEIRQLMDYGVKLLVWDYRGKSLDKWKLLLESGWLPNRILAHNFYPTQEVLKLALDSGADPSCHKSELLYQACRKGDFEIAEMLLNAGANLYDNYATQSLLIETVERCTSDYVEDYAKVVKLLLKFDINPIKKENRALKKSLQAGHHEITKILLSDERIRDYLNYSNIAKKYQKEVDSVLKGIFEADGMIEPEDELLVKN